MTSPFSQRTYLGWISDLASAPDPHAPWPSMRRDAALLEDYERATQTVSGLGFQSLCVWGLAASRDWPLDLKSAFSSVKRDFAAALKEKTVARDLKLTAGLGVFSWGFDEIIRAFPHLGPTNPHALCPHQNESFDWMRRVVDTVFEELPIDGVQMQSADLGRCECQKCAKWNALEHHAHLNREVAQTIRAQWPGKTVTANGWGMNFGDEAALARALPMLREMGAVLDGFTPIDQSGTRFGRQTRRILIENLSCPVGTLGGAQVEPPQHWARDRWFLPIARRTSDHVRELAHDGGRSCEAFFHIEANPGDELSLHVRGLALQNPFDKPQTHLQTAVRALYAPQSEAALKTLCDLFTRAEDAFFGRASGVPLSTFSLEPLVSGEAGPPVYLDFLSETARRDYARELEELRPRFLALQSEVEAPQKLELIARCLQNAVNDARGLS